MLNLLHRLALRLYPHRGWILGLAGALCIALLLLAGLATPGMTNLFALPAIIALAWTALLALLLADFQSPPPVAEPGMGRWARLKVTLRRLRYGMLALLFAASTALAGLVSLRLLLVWMHDL